MPPSGVERKPQARKSSQAALTLAALGIVYGDIGTSPLYAVKETFAPEHGFALSGENILGGLSAIFWALMIVVTLKYVVLVMRADNRGEGGTMALIALASAAVRERPELRLFIVTLGLFGASLFYGEAVPTPPISVGSGGGGRGAGALAPGPALGFVTGHGFASFVVLGAVLLAFTGAEALYADMGHFGRWPIRIAWFGLVLPGPGGKCF